MTGSKGWPSNHHNYHVRILSTVPANKMSNIKICNMIMLYKRDRNSKDSRWDINLQKMPSNQQKVPKMSSFKVKGQFMATFMMFDLEIHREFQIIFEINTWPMMFRLVRVRFFSSLNLSDCFLSKGDLTITIPTDQRKTDRKMTDYLNKH